MIVDGRRVAAPPDSTVLDAARSAGIEIPALCHHPALPAAGACRLCVVEVEGRGVHPACLLPASDDLVVTTDSERLRAARRASLSLLLDGYTPGVGRPDNELLRLAERSGLAPCRGATRSWRAIDEGNPLVRFDPNACVRCWRCVRACESLNGLGIIGVFGRNGDAHVGFGHDQPMHGSGCEFCGMCEAVCPTDALSVKIGGLLPESAGRTVSTVCDYCGVGCRMNLQLADDRIAGTTPDWHAPANHGLLCVKGRFGWGFVQHPDRLTRPLVRRALLEGHGTDLVETDWDTALDLVARTLVRIRNDHGADRLGFLASAKYTNEENYLFQKLARQ